MSALVLAGLVTAGSSTSGGLGDHRPDVPKPLLNPAAVASPVVALQDSGAPSTGTVGLLPSSPKPAKKLRAATPVADAPVAGAPFAGGVPLHDVAIPSIVGAVGIPEIVLAAYRNAELALAASDPNCGVSWNLLAGIGRIESGHASNGRTDAAGTTQTQILGPALDGTLPGNEIIRHVDGSAVRAIGPMQFLPGTWRFYASDGNGDGASDPNNVFDAALAAAKYLCSGGLNLRDPSQELRAVLRYNNSMSYAANVLSWSAAYRTGGAPTAVDISPGLIAPGLSPVDTAALVAAAAADSATATTTTDTTTTTTTAPPTTTSPTPQMINIPGLPPIPCGIFCPPPPPPPAPASPPPAVADEAQQQGLQQAAPPVPETVAPAAPAAPAPEPAPPAAEPAPMPVIQIPGLPPIPLQVPAVVVLPPAPAPAG